MFDRYVENLAQKVKKQRQFNTSLVSAQPVASTWYLTTYPWQLHAGHTPLFQQYQQESDCELPPTAPGVVDRSSGHEFHDEADDSGNNVEVETYNPRIRKLRTNKSRTDSPEALDKLQSIAYLVFPVMQKFDLAVGCLKEMDPEKAEEAGVLAWNKDRGRQIRIKLRDLAQPGGWRNMDDLVDSMLHELVHNEHGEHDRHFMARWNEFRNEWERVRFTGYRGHGPVNGIAFQQNRTPQTTAVRREPARNHPFQCGPESSAVGRQHGMRAPVGDSDHSMGPPQYYNRIPSQRIREPNVIGGPQSGTYTAQSSSSAPDRPTSIPAMYSAGNPYSSSHLCTRCYYKRIHCRCGWSARS